MGCGPYMKLYGIILSVKAKINFNAVCTICCVPGIAGLCKHGILKTCLMLSTWQPCWVLHNSRLTWLRLQVCALGSFLSLFGQQIKLYVEDCITRETSRTAICRPFIYGSASHAWSVLLQNFRVGFAVSRMLSEDLEHAFLCSKNRPLSKIYNSTTLSGNGTEAMEPKHPLAKEWNIGMVVSLLQHTRLQMFVI